MADIAREAEEVGFDKCWVYDEGIITRDPYVTLAAIAGQTSKIRLGTGITNPFSRHPELLQLQLPRWTISLTAGLFQDGPVDH